MFVVDVTLYTGQHLQCEPEDIYTARACARSLALTTMVESIDVIDARTGEVIHSDVNAAAKWRIE